LLIEKKEGRGQQEENRGAIVFVSRYTEEPRAHIHIIIMYIGPDDYYRMYQEIKKNALSRKSRGICSILIFVAMDVDALCAARILTVSMKLYRCIVIFDDHMMMMVVAVES
jgi:hypothetical protein